MTQDFPYPQIGAVLRNSRRAQKLTQAELADMIGISRASMANIEAGRQRILVGQLYEFANALKIDVNELLPSVDVQKSKSSEQGFAPPINQNLPQSFVEATKRVLGGRT